MLRLKGISRPILAALAAALAPNVALAQRATPVPLPNAPHSPIVAMAGAAALVPALALPGLSLPAPGLAPAEPSAPQSLARRVIGFGRALETRSDDSAPISRPIGFGRAKETPSADDSGPLERRIGFEREAEDTPAGADDRHGRKTSLKTLEGAARRLLGPGPRSTRLQRSDLERLYDGGGTQEEPSVLGGPSVEAEAPPPSLLGQLEPAALRGYRGLSGGSALAGRTSIRKRPSSTFNFRTLNPTSRYYAMLRITGIESRDAGATLVLSAEAEGGPAYQIISRPGGIEIAEQAQAPMPMNTSDLRGIEAAIKRFKAPREELPLHAAMLRRVRLAMRPESYYDPTDPLSRHLWHFDFRRVNPTIAYYGNLRVAQTRAVGAGLEMRLGSKRDRILLRWNPISGFKFERDGIVYPPGTNELNGARIALMRAMLESGSREPAQFQMLAALSGRPGGAGRLRAGQTSSHRGAAVRPRG